MLSVLIPTYNYNTYPLVKSLERQLSKTNIDFEILCRDDNPIDSLIENEKINTLPNSRLIKAKSCKGLSFNRNTLAKESKYEYLLFIDGDSIIIDVDYISNYITSINNHSDIIYGGRVHPKIVKKNQRLRWKYGRLREDLNAVKRKKSPYKCLFFNNCIIKKNIFESITFNENIKQYGHEDTILAYQLSLKELSIQHINNPVLHNDVDQNEQYLEKTKKSIQNLNFILNNKIIDPDFVSILKLFNSIKKLKIDSLIALTYKLFNKLLNLQLRSSQPSIFLFDLYRLSYLCHINLKK